VGQVGEKSAVQDLGALVGRWRIEISHPSAPSSLIIGRAEFQWLEGEQFVVERWEIDRPEFPNGLAVYAPDTQHYFDSRGVARIFEMSIGGGEWRLWREGDDFSQRFTGRFDDGGSVIDGYWEIAEDGSTFEHDFSLTFRKVS
jgi:hypothetical protein